MNITEIRIKLMNYRGEKLQAFCTITFDNAFVIRDLRIIKSSKGFFVAMPSRKFMDRCPKCGGKNHLKASFCNDCGARLPSDRAPRDPQGRPRLHADIAHPINAETRELIHTRVMRAFEEELEKSKLPGYIPPSDIYDDDYLGDFQEELEELEETVEFGDEEELEQPRSPRSETAQVRGRPRDRGGRRRGSSRNGRRSRSSGSRGSRDSRDTKETRASRPQRGRRGGKTAKPVQEVEEPESVKKAKPVTEADTEASPELPVEEAPPVVEAPDEGKESFKPAQVPEDALRTGKGEGMAEVEEQVKGVQAPAPSISEEDTQPVPLTRNGEGSGAEEAATRRDDMDEDAARERAGPGDEAERGEPERGEEREQKADTTEEDTFGEGLFE